MQIKSDQLNAHLATGLRPLYTVWGDEPLLAQEAGDAIRAAARAGGCSERQVHTVSGQHFDWSGLLGAQLHRRQKVCSEASRRITCETMSPCIVRNRKFSSCSLPSAALSV